ncbi:MAG: hypothetical protein AAF789_03050 [Bacteroidota bacterium]
MNKYSRALSVVVLLAIVSYGFLKVLFCRIYSVPIAAFIELIGFSPDQVLSTLHDFQNRDQKQLDHLLGWFIYYPTYLLLHLIFIQLLFWQDKKLRRGISIGLILVVGFLLACIGLGKLLDIYYLHYLSYTLFQKLFGLPFILLTIEGGRVFFSDINKRFQEKEEAEKQK